MGAALRLLVLDAYDAAGRRALEAVGATPAGTLYARMLARHAPEARVDVAMPADPGPLLPRGVGLGDYDGVAWTGSSLSVLSEDDARVRHMLELVRATAAAGVPAFGSCFAIQLAAVAAGGACEAHPRGREFGVVGDLRPSAAGRDHPLLAGRPASWAGLASHADHVARLPAGTPALAANDWSPVQALALEGPAPFWAVQYHPEYDLREVARLALLRADELVAQGRFASRDAVRAWVHDMESLQARPHDAALRERLGVEEALLDPDRRETEVRNWLARRVRPRARR